jgi:hypothetical protein
MHTLAARIMALALAVAALALCVLAWQAARHGAVPDTGSAYQAVALANGQVYFGRLEPAAEGYLALRDVFYVQTRQNPDTRAVANVLVKRGSEAHGPDRMLVNRAQVLLVEPVGPASQIGKLIAEQRGK